MTREIKFRAWDYDEEIMRKNWTDIAVTDADRVILMQFTGLLDKNGKEIYEGDIVKHTQHEGYTLESFVGDFQYIQFGYMIKTPTFWVELGRIDELQRDLLDHIEVIGNIYENPELLKE